MVKSNGTEQPLEGQTLAAYLHGAGYDVTRIAVEKNGVIVPKDRYEETILEAGDSLEVVSFVGGG